MQRLLAGVNILLAATVLAWPVGLFVLLFMFDAPGAGTRFWTDVAAVSILLYPVPVIVGNIAFWRKRRVATVKQLARYTLLSLSGPGFVVLAHLALEVLCGGRYTCG